MNNIAAAWEQIRRRAFASFEIQDGLEKSRTAKTPSRRAAKKIRPLGEELGEPAARMGLVNSSRHGALNRYALEGMERGVSSLQ